MQYGTIRWAYSSNYVYQTILLLVLGNSGIELQVHHTRVSCSCSMLHVAATCCGDRAMPSSFKLDSEKVIAESIRVSIFSVHYLI